MPADRRAIAAAELEPVFEALAAVMVECESLRRSAAVAGARRVAEADARGRALTARARTEAEAERAAEAARLRDRATAEVRRAMARAHEEAAGVRRRAELARPRLLALVLDRVRAELAAIGRDGRG